MKRVYELYVTRLTEDGWSRGEQRVAVVSSKAKAVARVKAFREEHEVHEYWMTYALDADKHIRVRIEEVEVE